MPTKQGTAKSRYQELQTDRDIYLSRARECAKLTIPSLFMPEGSTAGTKIRTPYQSIGARGANNLSSKFTFTQLPPNDPFFRFIVDPTLYEEEENDHEIRSEIEQALSKYEKRVMWELEATGDRTPVGEAFLNLVVGGNVLLYDSPSGMRVFQLPKYVVKRGPAGQPIEIVVKENLAPASLPEDFQQKLKDAIKKVQKKGSNEKTVELYTHLKLDGDTWTVYQECLGRKVPGTKGTYPKDKCPWMPLRFVRIDGEDYGRSYVEEYLGDLKSLEALTEAIVEGSAMAAKVIVFVDPTGQTRARKVAEADTGDVLSGNASDVTILHMDKHADFSVAERMADRFEQRLSHAFLLHTAIQRNAERVTAEEIRFMAQELDTAISGIYSILAQEFQLPYIRQKIAKLERQNKLPDLPHDLVRPTVITGVEALRRGEDRNKLVMFIKTLAETLGPDILSQILNLDELVTRLATHDRIEIEGLIKDKEERQSMQEQGQMMDLVKQLGPKGMELIKQQLAEQGQQAPAE